MKVLTDKEVRNNNINNQLIDYAVKINFGVAKEEVKKSDSTVGELKELTLDIMNAVSIDGNSMLMHTIARNVHAWKNDKTSEWKSTLSSYARSRVDIMSIYVGRNESGDEFIIVADDVTSDEILDHNEFCFELVDKYDGIDNFMVLDMEEFESMDTMFRNHRKIYQRG